MSTFYRQRKCKYAESKGKELLIKNKNNTYLEDFTLNTF